MCTNCRAFITTDDRVCPYCDMKQGERAVDRRAVLEDDSFFSQSRFTTSIILVICFGLYAATGLMSANSSGSFFNLSGRVLFDLGAKLSAAVFAGEWWRLVTAGFLHGGLLHILMNSWVLFGLGPQVDEVFGTSRFIVIYFAGTVAGFLASSYWSPSLSVGASAGIFGLIGSMIAYGTQSRTSLGAAVKSHYTQWAIYGIVMGLLPGFQIDNAAHLGGLAAGYGIATLAGPARLVIDAKEKIWLAAAWICGLLTAVSFLLMFLRFISVRN